MKWLGPAFVLLLAGCVTLTPTQELSVEEIRTFADATARAYGLPRPYILPGDFPNAGATWQRGTLTVNLSTLRSPNRDAIIAHELGHMVLRHEDRLRATTQLDARREQEQREVDANAAAIEILVRVKGVNEADALRAFHRYLAGAHARGAWATGHTTPCEEIADLLRRFPRHRALTASWECAPSEGASRR